MEFSSKGKCSERRFPNPGRPVRVMVVDDYPDTAEVVALYLSAMGYEARYVTMSVRAQKQADSYRPDIVLVDINMPGLDGYQVATAMRAADATREAVLIAHTSEVWEAIETRALVAGFDGYFRKATGPQELVPFLSTYIDDSVR
ncbi:response regulator [Burkholderia gladioli]|uniref:response regulator n=1 Tax=Burkholderia gladioli TaxID=28095 RepID=UPI00163E7019|nr:response regulator [Burkholderia gladioli]